MESCYYYTRYISRGANAALVLAFPLPLPLSLNVFLSVSIQTELRMKNTAQERDLHH